MVGILKNPLSQEQIPVIDESENVAEFRKQVLKNTQLNAKLTKGKTSAGYNLMSDNELMAGDGVHRGFVPKDSLSLKHEHDVPTMNEAESLEDDQVNLQWNKQNLAENEIKKLQYQDIHVDEPKTPYQGAVDPSGEYYKIDEDDDFGDNSNGKEHKGDNLNDLDDLNLGEPEYELNPIEDNGRIEVDKDAEEHDDDDDDEMAKAVKHKRFEEMRKKHYNVKEIFKNKHTSEDEDEDDDKE